VKTIDSADRMMPSIADIIGGAGGGGGGGGGSPYPSGFIPGSGGATVSTIGDESRMMETPYDITDTYDLPTRARPDLAGVLSPWAGVQMPKQMTWQQNLRASFGIGKDIHLPNGQVVPWASATPRQRLFGVAKSPGFASMAASVGMPMFMSSLQGGGALRGIEGVAGGALAGYGLASMFGAWGPAGAVAGAGAGLFAAGYKQRGVGGLAMTTFGGFLAGVGIGTMIMPGIGTIVGAAIGAAVGLGVGVVNLFRKSKDDQLRSLLRQTYGIDVPDANIRKQILDLADQKYGGDIRMAVFSTEVQDMMRLYAVSTGQSTAGLPRPMYSATFAQSQAGGLQLQPVYSNGYMVQNPYSGTTTSQFQNSGIYQFPNLFIQLNPQQASDLFAGQVTQVINNNPAAVGQANATAIGSGSSRIAQASSMIEPMTVTR
jgi:hypothetical protein